MAVSDYGNVANKGDGDAPEVIKRNIYHLKMNKTLKVSKLETAGHGVMICDIASRRQH